MVKDKALISAVLQGDQQAFRLLIRQNERLVAHMIGRLVKNREEVEELCQDVFMKVYDKLGTFNYNSRLSTWIASIAYRLSINHLRKRKLMYTRFPDEIETEKIADMQAERTMDDHEIDLLVLNLSDRLPPQYKTALMLYHVDGLSYSEIVDITGQPEGTVKSYIFRARKLLKEIVLKYLGKEELI
ncbi:MAG TPA: sigma-70 family RNA polymerase sigma factor [Cyclobacteriaceae bacterium]|nr:sigma-70 family RNA polymerase sigma factor [Cyclobacteriaceae bacterium]